MFKVSTKVTDTQRISLLKGVMDLLGGRGENQNEL